MKIYHIIPLFFTVFSATIFAGDNAGRTGFELLRFDLGARPSAIGSAFTAQTGDLHGMAYNPACMADLPDRAMTATYTHYIASIQTGFLAYNKTLSENRNLSFALSYFHYGQMDETDENGRILGTFSPGDLLLMTVFSNQVLPGLVYGVGLKLVHSQLADYQSTGGALDAGLTYMIHSENLRFGASVRNMGRAFTAYIDEKEKMPLMYRLGVSKQLAHLPMVFNLDLIRYHFEANTSMLGFYWALGGEFTLSPQLLFRWGYNARGMEQRYGGGTDRFSGLTLGFGLNLEQIRFDFSHVSMGMLGTVQTFSISSGL